LERLPELGGWFACFKIDDKAQADAGSAREFVLPQASGLASGSNDVADLDWREDALCHDIYRSGKYHGCLRNVYGNFPLGKKALSGGTEKMEFSRSGISVLKPTL
jgi:hypothetical protein